MGSQYHISSYFTPEKEAQYALYSKLVGPRAGQDSCRKFAPHYDLIPRLSSPKSVAIQTMIHVTKQKDMTETEFI